MNDDELIRWLSARLVDMAVQVEELRELKLGLCSERVLKNLANN